jgi:hypothetical protein
MALTMTERRVDPLVALLASLALCAPAPAIAQGRFLMVANCLGGATRIDLPADPAEPSSHDCCKKGCHAASDRRKKGQQDGENCC